MSAAVRPNGNRVNLDFTQEMIDANPEGFKEVVAALVIGVLNDIYLPFNPAVKEIKNRETGVTQIRNENWHVNMVARANAKMKEIFPSIETAKVLPAKDKLELAHRMKALRARIEVEEPLLMEVVRNQKVMNELCIKDVNHVILGYLTRYTWKTEAPQAKKSQIIQA